MNLVDLTDGRSTTAHDLVTSGNKPLPEPVLIKAISDTWRHYATKIGLGAYMTIWTDVTQ